MFCKIKCYVNTFNKKKSIKVIAYRYSTIIYWTKFPWVSHFLKKKAIFTFRTAFSLSFAMKFQRRHWLEDFAWRVEPAWKAWHKNSGYRDVCFLSVLSLLCGRAKALPSLKTSNFALYFSGSCIPINESLLLLAHTNTDTYRSSSFSYSVVLLFYSWPKIFLSFVMK
jgi:hypothetical protein